MPHCIAVPLKDTIHPPPPPLCAFVLILTVYIYLCSVDINECNSHTNVKRKKNLVQNMHPWGWNYPCSYPHYAKDMWHWFVSSTSPTCIHSGSKRWHADFKVCLSKEQWHVGTLCIWMKDVPMPRNMSAHTTWFCILIRFSYYKQPCVSRTWCEGY
jgi:hypothetical protein